MAMTNMKFLPSFSTVYFPLLVMPVPLAKVHLIVAVVFVVQVGELLFALLHKLDSLLQ